ncbi:hypothetical protein FHL81_19945 [Agrobacterium tumefaciens]|nr:hypothetical protein FHL81_19945 [Agrobacterium tumefaciens]
MLQLSDAASSGLFDNDDAYLTGYPLPDSGYYALAKTWPAAEMPRPGCVWTHTLLIALDDIGGIENFGELVDAFKRPDRAVSGYDGSIDITLEPAARFEPIDQVNATTVFSAIYGKPASKIVQDRPLTGADNIVMAIWSQQWPRLRAGFRFCTGTGSDRSMMGHEFDLQFITGGQGARNRFANCVMASDVTSFTATAWHRHGLRDLLEPNVDGFRAFARGVGDDLQSGRRAFAHVAQFHLFMRDEYNVASTKNAVLFLRDNLKAIKNRNVAVTIANRVVDQIRNLDNEVLEYALEDLSLLASRSNSDYFEVGERILNDSTDRFWLLESDKIGTLIVNETLKTIEDQSLLEILAAEPNRASRILSVRPSIVGLSSFWVTGHFGAAELKIALKIDSGLASLAATAIIEAGRHDLVKDVHSILGRDVLFDHIWELVTRRGVTDIVQPWFALLCADRRALAGYLALGNKLSLSLLSEVASIVAPDELPNQIGIDPWLTAARGQVWSRFDRQTIGLAGYLFYRALGPASKNAGELAAVTLPLLHAAAAKNLVDDVVWSTLSSRLPKSLFGWDWDRCWRLRAAFVDLLVSGQPPSVLANLKADDDLFMAISHWAMRSSRGREYLLRVNTMLAASPKSTRAKALRKLL